MAAKIEAIGNSLALIHEGKAYPLEGFSRLSDSMSGFIDINAFSWFVSPECPVMIRQTNKGKIFTRRC